jgi:hypothetical protein
VKLKDLGLISREGLIFKGNGRKPLSQDDVMVLLQGRGVSFKERAAMVELLEAEAQSSYQPEASFEEYLVARKEILEQSIYHKHLKTIKDESGIKAYITAKDGWRCLGLAKELDAKYLLKEFTEKYGTNIRELTSLINEIIPQTKSKRVVKHEEVAEMYLEDIMPSEEKWVLKTMISPPAPLLLKGDNRPAFGYLDYERKENPKLNKYMEEFLSRMHNHEYFCAYIFCTFLGIEIQQLLYMYGEGQNGKSSFTKVLGNKTRSVAAYSSKSKHDFVHLEGKAFIVIPESDGGHVLRNSDIKKITGKDMITIDPKFKQAYSGRIQGTILIDSNNLPYIVGERSETRRMRVFEMKPVTTKETIDANVYLEYMGEDFNDFVNYCRVCYEKLKQPDGVLIQDPPDLEEQMESLIDPDMVTSYDKMLKTLRTRWKVEVISSLQIPATELREYINNAANMLHGKFEDKYFSKNFIKYLKCKKLISEDKGTILGMGIPKAFEDPTILAVMPKF